MPAPICKQMKISDKIITATKSSCHDIDLTMEIDNFWPFFCNEFNLGRRECQIGSCQQSQASSVFCHNLCNWMIGLHPNLQSFSKCGNAHFKWHFCNICQSGLYDTIQTNVPFQECKTQNTISIKVVPIRNWIVHSNSVFDKLDLFLQS